MTFISNYIYWIPTIIWMILIFYFSGQTSSELHAVFPFIDNLNPGHIAAYFVLAILAFYSFYKSTIKRPMVAALLLSVCYGITDEFHQAFVPGRHPDIWDLIRDSTGALIALLIICFVKKKKIYKRSSDRG